MSSSDPFNVHTGAPRSVALDHLRSLLTLLVIAHHAVLAYFLYAPPPGKFNNAMWWAAFPIVDPAKAPGIDALILWNDTFFMALLFLLAGIFTGPSLLRKGSAKFLRDRALRLGVPFLIGALVLAPLAYFPAYAQRTGALDVAGFGSAWKNLSVWPAGPMWFLWVLLAFSLVTAAVQKIAPRALTVLGNLGMWCRQSPLRCAGVWVTVAVLAYVPLTLIVNPMHWTGWTVFAFQTSRGMLYAVYFAFGLALGWRGNPTDDLMAQAGGLARRWIAWLVVAGVVFVLFTTVLIVTSIKAGKGELVTGWSIATAALMAVSGVATSMGLLAWFARKPRAESRFWTALRPNAFGMYLVHYAVVTWLQYALLPMAWPGLVKAAVVTVGAIALSWMITVALRRIPGVRTIL